MQAAHSTTACGPCRSTLTAPTRRRLWAIPSTDPRLTWTDDVADHARTVVVPLANPDTATDLLRVARALLPSEGGRVLAHVIVLDDADAEKSSETSSAMQDLVDVMRDRLAGASVELRTRTATSVARGILDAVRDSGADAIVLGVRSGADGTTRIGPVVESVIRAATCDVLVYRAPHEGGLDDVGRVVVAVDGELPSRNALRVSTFLRQGLGSTELLVHVHPEGASRRAADDAVARAMRGLVENHECEVEYVTAPDVVSGLTQAVKDTDLLVIGVGHAERSSEFGSGSASLSMLDAVQGPVLAVARQEATTSGAQERARRALAWLHPRLTDLEQETIRSYAEGASEPTLDYVTMTVLSGVIAALGLLLDSAAVIIGAMLVAPLMQPIQAFGIAVVAGRTSLAIRGLFTVVLGTGLVLLLSVITGWVFGISTPTGQILARGSPSLLDAGVALAAGMAGAYATARKGIPAALAGTAIAAALVPPIGAAGLGLAAGRWSLAAGAILLFTVNIVCIAVVSAVVLQWLGLRPKDRYRTEEGQIGLAIGTVGVLVVLLAALVFLDARRIRLDEDAVASVIEDAVEGVEVTEVGQLGDADQTTVRVVVDAFDLDDEDRDRLLDLATAAVRGQLDRDVVVRVDVREVLQSP